MNSNTLYLFLFILIIICAICYLVRMNNKENSCIEKFSQTNSLSTMYQQTIDDNEYQDKYRKNEYNQFNLNNNDTLLESMWNGNWNDNENPPTVFASFLELNDQLIFSLSKQSFNLDETTGQNTQNTQNNKCLYETFVGIGQLNSKKNMFVLKKILCSLNLTDDKSFINNLDLSVNKLIGIATKEGITLKDESDHILILNDKKNSHKYDNYSSYLQLSSFVNPIPVLQRDFDANTDVCANSTFTKDDNEYGRGSLEKCYIKNQGLPIPPNDGFDSYGTGCSPKANITHESYTDSNGISKSYPVCANSNTQTCWIEDGSNRTYVGPPENPFTKCNTQFSINRKFNSSLIQGFTNSEVCNYLQNFSETMYNCCIFLYVSDLNNVESLSYEYFGQGDGKSNLTMQYDISSMIIEPLLAKYRSYITGKYINIDGGFPYREGGYSKNKDYERYTRGWALSNGFNGSNEDCKKLCDEQPECINGGCESILYKQDGRCYCKFTPSITKPALASNSINIDGGFPYREGGYSKNKDYGRYTRGWALSNGFNGSNEDCKKLCDEQPECINGGCESKLYEQDGRCYCKFTPRITESTLTVNQDQIQQALSLTNCFSSKDIVSSYSNLLESCKSTLSAELNSQSSKNKTLNNLNKNKLPMVWSVKKANGANNSSCTFSISSSKLYTKESQWQKFAEFDPRYNKTKMSLYEGGTNQVITLENATILTQSNESTSNTSGINTKHILVSGNLKTSNPKKFLIPSKVKNGFYNDSSMINLKNTPNDNGKWIMFGFNLMNIQDLEKTLKAIQAKL
jgi:hypothetical protein